MTIAFWALYAFGAAFTAYDLRRSVRTRTEAVALVFVAALWPIVLILSYDDDR